jgi:hypothetical protein
MTPQIRLENISALTDMRMALKRFSGNIISTLDLIEMHLRRNEESLKDKLNEDKRSVERSIHELENAREALYERENCYDDDEPPDCSYEEDAVLQAQADLENAEQQLAFTRQMFGRATKQFQEYRALAGKTKKLMTSDVTQAQALLNSKVSSIEDYKSIVAEPFNNFSEILNTGTHDSSLIYPSPANAPTFPTTGAPGQGERVPQGPLHPAGTFSGQGSWVEMGIVNFNLNCIHHVEGILSGDDFKKVSKGEMEAGLNKYVEMKDLIDSGEGSTKDYWAAVDRTLGLTYEEGYQRIYEAFFGSEPIRITKDGDTYTIENGRHRIWLAKQMGITSLPASVIKKKE